jgi:hypothetical protein
VAVSTLVFSTDGSRQAALVLAMSGLHGFGSCVRAFTATTTPTQRFTNHERGADLLMIHRHPGGGETVLSAPTVCPCFGRFAGLQRPLLRQRNNFHPPH